jgi:hypothetical protein
MPYSTVQLTLSDDATGGVVDGELMVKDPRDIDVILILATALR